MGTTAFLFPFLTSSSLFFAAHQCNQSPLRVVCHRVQITLSLTCANTTNPLGAFNVAAGSLVSLPPIDSRWAHLPTDRPVGSVGSNVKDLIRLAAPGSVGVTPQTPLAAGRINPVELNRCPPSGRLYGDSNESEGCCQWLQRR